jgi:hypothetical protein
MICKDLNTLINALLLSKLVKFRFAAAVVMLLCYSMLCVCIFEVINKNRDRDSPSY